MNATTNFVRQVSRALDEEHRASLDLLSKVEQALARVSLSGGSRDAGLVTLMAGFGRQLEREVARHFDFEEKELFPRMSEAGSGDLAVLLLEEHEVIRSVARELLPLTRTVASGALDDHGWATLRRSALEMIERLRSHIDKETMALLPVLEDLLDEDTDRELAFTYAST
jgi:hemerythrin-like domain-containing protein